MYKINAQANLDAYYSLVLGIVHDSPEAFASGLKNAKVENLEIDQNCIKGRKSFRDLVHYPDYKDSQSFIPALEFLNTYSSAKTYIEGRNEAWFDPEILLVKAVLSSVTDFDEDFSKNVFSEFISESNLNKKIKLSKSVLDDLSVRDYDNLSLLDIACYINAKPVINILLDLGADPGIEIKSSNEYRDKSALQIWSRFVPEKTSEQLPLIDTWVKMFKNIHEENFKPFNNVFRSFSATAIEKILEKYTPVTVEEWNSIYSGSTRVFNNHEHKSTVLANYPELRNAIGSNFLFSDAYEKYSRKRENKKAIAKKLSLI